MRWALSLLLLTTACGDNNSLWLGLPADVEAQSAVVAVIGSGPDVLHAIEVADEVLINLDFEKETNGRVEWLAYDADLTTLGLTEGLIVAAEPDSLAVPLPLPEATYHAEFAGRTVTDWHAGTMSDELVDFRVPSSNRCTEFEVFPIELEATNHARFVLPVTNDEVIIATQDARAFRYTSTGPTEIVMTPTVAISGGYVTGPDNAWAFALDGRVYRVTYTGEELQLSPLPPSPVGRTELRWGATLPIGDTVEVFAVGYPGEVLHYDGAVWSVIEERGPSSKGGLVILAPGEAIMGTGSETTITRYSGGRVTKEPLANEGVTMLERTQSGRIYLAAGQGLLYTMRPDGSFDLLGQSAISLDIYAIRETSRGFLYGGANGFLGEYLDDVGFCPAATLAPGSIWEIVPFEDGFVIMGDQRDVNRNPNVAFIRPRT